MKTLLCLTVAVCLLLPAARARAGGGDLDPAFGAGGKVVRDLPGTAAGDGTVRVVTTLALADGKVLTAEQVNVLIDGGLTCCTSLVGLSRLLADGSADAGFGIGGTLIVPPFFPGDEPGEDPLSQVNDDVFDAVRQPDGKLVLLTTAETDPGTVVSLSRRAADGTLDTSFGTGGRVDIGGPGIGQFFLFA